jgi:uncharacterized RDD family membrane protein YckC
LVFMNCSLCGEVCRCPEEPLPAALKQCDPAAESEAAVGLVQDGQAQDDQVQDDQVQDSQVQDARTMDAQGEDVPPWRDELSARLSRYRARRRVRPPRYPSLRLQFGELDWSTRANLADRSAPVPRFESVSNQALALDEMRHGSHAAAETDVECRQAPAAAETLEPVHPPAGHQAGRASALASGHFSGHVAGHAAGAKIIEFPRLAWGPPPPPPDQLAEPVSERPRILEVAEVAPPPPALGGITIEAAEEKEIEKRPGIDIPLQSAPLGLRLVAALVDGLIIVTASAFFGFIFWKIAAVRPPLVQMLGLGAGIPCLFWAAYQYLLIVYGASTPGLRVAGLELTRFDGTPASRSLRRWRALAGCLSGLSLGMGYAWVFLDEDALCWHDRITHTYLAPRKRAAATTRFV